MQRNRASNPGEDVFLSWAQMNEIGPGEERDRLVKTMAGSKLREEAKRQITELLVKTGWLR